MLGIGTLPLICCRSRTSHLPFAWLSLTAEMKAITSCSQSLSQQPRETSLHLGESALGSNILKKIIIIIGLFNSNMQQALRISRSRKWGTSYFWRAAHGRCHQRPGENGRRSRPVAGERGCQSGNVASSPIAPDPFHEAGKSVLISASVSPSVSLGWCSLSSLSTLSLLKSTCACVCIRCNCSIVINLY